MEQPSIEVIFRPDVSLPAGARPTGRGTVRLPYPDAKIECEWDRAYPVLGLHDQFRPEIPGVGCSLTDAARVHVAARGRLICMSSQAAEEQAARLEPDPWQEIIEEFMHTKVYVSDPLDGWFALDRFAAPPTWQQYRVARTYRGPRDGRRLCPAWNFAASIQVFSYRAALYILISRLRDGELRLDGPASFRNALDDFIESWRRGGRPLALMLGREDALGELMNGRFVRLVPSVRVLPASAPEPVAAAPGRKPGQVSAKDQIARAGERVTAEMIAEGWVVREHGWVAERARRVNRLFPDYVPATIARYLQDLVPDGRKRQNPHLRGRR